VATFSTTKYFGSVWKTGCVEETVHTRDKMKRENRKKIAQHGDLKFAPNIEVSSSTCIFIAIVRISNLSVRYPSATSALCASTVEPTREITTEWQEPVMLY